MTSLLRAFLAFALISIVIRAVSAVFKGLSGEAETKDGRENRVRVFCASVGAIFAKMAKADGHVTRDEIATVESAFARLGFSAADRALAVTAFRAAKDDDRSIYEYAESFAAVCTSLEVRAVFYELLWDVACADGVVSPKEDEILKFIPRYLGIPVQWYLVFAREHYARSSARGGARHAGGGYAPPPAQDKLAEAYSLLGVASSASDDEVKKAYRAKAKKYHPDTLRTQGLPDEMIGKATEQMSRINAAWGEIKSARGL